MKEIPLTRGYVALVDDEDYEELARHKWHAAVRRHLVYACRDERTGGKRKTVLMHKLITGHPQTDHENGDGLDNRRSNLRAATTLQNGHNRRPRAGGSSKYTGVHWDSATSKWRAMIAIDGKSTHLGLFASEGAAARAYDKAARERDPEFCRLNFP